MSANEKRYELTVDGVRLVYHVAGAGPVLIAHSGRPGLDRAYLRSPELERHFTVVYPEPVGTGSSGRLAGYRLDTYVRFLAALVDELGPGPARIGGHSHGGFVALEYALDYPDRVTGLVLYDTSPMTGPEFWGAAMAAPEGYPRRYPDHPAAAEIPAAIRRALAARDDEALTSGLRAALPVYLAPRADGTELQVTGTAELSAPTASRGPSVHDTLRMRSGCW